MINATGERPLPTLLRLPAQPGPRPLVVFSHGYLRLPEDYEVLFQAWVAAGFLVVAPTFPKTARDSADLDFDDFVGQPSAVRSTLDHVLQLSRTDGHRLFGRVDETRIAAAGHSLGGVTTVALFASERDDRIKAGIVLAGSAYAVGTGYRAPNASLLFVHGDRDGAVPLEDGRAAYEAFPGPKAWLPLKGGDHRGPYLGTDPERTAVVRQATTDYLRWAFGDDAAFQRLTAVVGLSVGANQDQVP
ncbi:MAG: chlorophyllase [Hamadaea sp.]|uniref:alpha/beta hydrolase family protein n=1 Tax=Hamadaea sp. TaxID=2024425 RepID=UPI00184F304D|nr:chlorophyllase [Hamadaea sp.]NUR70916.1 chlorophyllase [Hamadaea sp.]NUT21703.1 chlorophyllase [Hamadaea sp.]